MAAVAIWVWQTGETPDGAPVLERCFADEPHPDDAWEGEQDAAAWRDEIMAALDAIDAKSIRALREGNAPRLAELEARAEMLRAQLTRLANA